jgi:hypothetical protein
VLFKSFPMNGHVSRFHNLEESSFRWSAAPLIQDGHYCRHLGFGFRRFSDQRLVQFFGGSSNMAATAAILDLVSVGYLTNACRLVRFLGASFGVINLHCVPLLPKLYRPYTHRQRPNRGHMPRLALPWSDLCFDEVDSCSLFCSEPNSCDLDKI